MMYSLNTVSLLMAAVTVQFLYLVSEFYCIAKYAYAQQLCALKIPTSARLGLDPGNFRATAQGFEILLVWWQGALSCWKRLVNIHNRL